MEQKIPRWQYRFRNYSRAYTLLQEISTRSQEEELEQIAREGMIHRFEFCLELAWKTMKDYMEYRNFVFKQVFPSIIIKEAFAANLIDKADDWLNALDDRNAMSHTYDFDKHNEVIQRIANT